MPSDNPFSRVLLAFGRTEKSSLDDSLVLLILTLGESLWSSGSYTFAVDAVLAKLATYDTPNSHAMQFLTRELNVIRDRESKGQVQ